MLPKPYWNYRDSENIEFLHKIYQERVPLFKSYDSEVICNNTNLTEYMETLKDDTNYADYKQIAFIGRSNVGKSTLINSILGQ